MTKMSCLSVDIPKDLGCEIKPFAPLYDMTVRDMMIDTFQKKIAKKGKRPNKTTPKVFQETGAYKNLHTPFKTVESLMADLLK